MRQLFRGRVLHCLDSPQAGGVQYLEDGVLGIDGGRIDFLLSAGEAQGQGLDLALCRPLGARLIVPGFIDLHVHAQQIDVVASYGEGLLEWLESYTFPAECRARDEAHAAEVAEAFLDEMLRHGTTSALVFSTSDERATALLFEAAMRRRLRLITGKVLMDRHAPAALLDGPDLGIPASRRLIEAWHGRERLHYAVTPRFAPTSSPAQLRAAGELLREYPGLYLQTHLAENRDEIAWVQALFPGSENYLEVYASHDLCTERSIFAHCVHLLPAEVRRLRDCNGKIAFCPSSNLFLGSGLFDWPGLHAAGMEIGLGSDIGAGTSLSMLKTLADAYRVCRLRGGAYPPLQAFHDITLGNARALQLGDKIGNLAPGSEADFLVLDPAGIPLLQRRLKDVKDIAEEWFLYMMLGDERLVSETWVAGARAKPASMA